MYSSEFWDKLYEDQHGTPPWIILEHKENAINLLNKYLPENLNGIRILDYGCGNGQIGNFYLEKGASVDFAEISSKMLGYLRENFIHRSELASTLSSNKTLGEAKVFGVQSPKELAVPEETYDYIIVRTVLHHVNPDYRKEFMNGFGKLIKKNGKIIISGWDESDVILKQDGFKGHITGKSSYAINSLPNCLDEQKYEVVDTGVIDNKIPAFDQARKLRYYVIKLK